MKKTLITLAALAMASVACAVEPAHTITEPTSGTTSGVTYVGENYAFTFTMVLDMNTALSGTSDLGDWSSPTGASLQKQANWWTNGIAIWDIDDSTEKTTTGANVSEKIYIALRDGNPQMVVPSTAPDSSSWYPMYGAGDAIDGKLILTYTYVAGEANEAGNRSGTQTLYILRQGENGYVQDVATRTTDPWGLDAQGGDALGQLALNDPTGAIDTLYIFNEALSAEQAQEFAESLLNPGTGGVTPDTPAIPEPTTATLSLLALAGLAARRRRK